MRCLSNVLALAVAVRALEITDYPDTVEVGNFYRITYDPDDGDTTFILRKGDPEALDTISTLTDSATGGQFLWIPDDGLSNGDDYALEIQQGDAEPNYSGSITVAGGSDDE